MGGNGTRVITLYIYDEDIENKQDNNCLTLYFNLHRIENGVPML